MDENSLTENNCFFYFFKSEFDMQMMQEEPKRKGKPIEEELRELDELLSRMQDVTLVPKFSDIFPR